MGTASSGRVRNQNLCLGHACMREVPCLFLEHYSKGVQGTWPLSKAKVYLHQGFLDYTIWVVCVQPPWASSDDPRDLNASKTPQGHVFIANSTRYGFSHNITIDQTNQHDH